MIYVDLVDLPLFLFFRIFLIELNKKRSTILAVLANKGGKYYGKTEFRRS
jgi:hypothetical protein